MSRQLHLDWVQYGKQVLSCWDVTEFVHGSLTLRLNYEPSPERLSIKHPTLFCAGILTFWLHLSLNITDRKYTLKIFKLEESVLMLPVYNYRPQNILTSDAHTKALYHLSRVLLRFQGISQ